MEERDLYQLPVAEFTAARNDLAAERKKAGDTEGAAAAKKLPKPNNAAWLVNRAAAEEPKAATALLKAGEKLRAAYEGAAGKGGAESLRKAIEAEAAAVDTLAGAAGRLAGEEKIGGDALDGARNTFHALSSDEELRTEFEAGTVARDRRASGLGGVIAPGQASAKSKEDRGQRKRIERAEAEVERAGEAVDEARAELKSAEEALARAVEEQREAKRALREAKGG